MCSLCVCACMFESAYVCMWARARACVRVCDAETDRERERERRNLFQVDTVLCESLNLRNAHTHIHISKYTFKQFLSAM